MARHKSRPVEEQGEPEMEISSMIDCCFLLLIYFLVATSLVSEKKLDVNIPGAPTSGGAPPPVEPGRIHVASNGSITWNDDMPVGDVYDAGAQPGTEAYRSQRNLTHCHGERSSHNAASAHRGRDGRLGGGRYSHRRPEYHGFGVTPHELRTIQGE